MLEVESFLSSGDRDVVPMDIIYKVQRDFPKGLHFHPNRGLETGATLVFGVMSYVSYYRFVRELNIDNEKGI